MAGSAYPQQFHLDVTVHQIEAAEQGVLALGATPLDGEGENWRVYADPAGKPFCLLWNAGVETPRGGRSYRDGGLTRLRPHGHGSDDPALSAATVARIAAVRCGSRIRSLRQYCCP